MSLSEVIPFCAGWERKQCSVLVWYCTCPGLLRTWGIVLHEVLPHALRIYLCCSIALPSLRSPFASSLICDYVVLIKLLNMSWFIVKTTFYFWQLTLTSNEKFVFYMWLNNVGTVFDNSMLKIKYFSWLTTDLVLLYHILIILTNVYWF